MFFNQRLKKAITLLELITAVLIIGILAALTLPRFNRTLEVSRASEARAALEQIRTAQRVYRLNQDFFFPHSSMSGEGNNIDTIFDDLHIHLGSRNWNFAISAAGGGFSATATRRAGANQGEQITIDETGNINDTGWTP